MESKKVKLKTLNPFITCYICHGYLIDATTVVDCLHTFCKSCLLKHFEEENNCCPKCESLIHQSHPSHYVSFDRQMQDIVYKLVPDLHKKEKDRREEFCKERGITLDEDMLGEEETKVLQPEQKPKVCTTSNADADAHRLDEQISVELACESANVKKLKRRFIRCSAHTTVLHIKKYLAKKMYFDMHRFKDIDVLCNDELMGKDHSLKFIVLTRWRTKPTPLELYYRKHIDL